MSGYFQMPEETARTLCDGWLHTGDVDYIGDEGFLYLKDRLRDVVIAFCKERVGSVKTPKHVHVVATLPRSPVGKVLRREARAAVLKL